MMLQAKRLNIRKASKKDAPFMKSLLCEPSFIQNIRDHKIQTLEDAEKYIEEKMCKLYAEDGLGAFIVELKESGIPIGICGIYRRANVEDVDIGFALLEKYWSQGYATEAAQAVLENGKKKLNLKRITGVTTKENINSAKVLERIGLQFEKSIWIEEEKKEMLLFSGSW